MMHRRPYPPVRRSNSPGVRALTALLCAPDDQIGPVVRTEGMPADQGPAGEEVEVPATASRTP